MENTYKQLREIDVSKKLEKKNGLSYLSWAWALDTLLQHDPNAIWEHPESKVFADGTVMVFCTVTAFGKARTAYLPVMNYKNDPIKNPNAFQYNTAMQRCLVKAIAMHGIGLHVYAGEDLPDISKEPVLEFTREHKIIQRDFMYGLSKQTTTQDVVEWLEAYKEDFQAMPHIAGYCTDSANSRIEQIRKRVALLPPKFGFVDVEEALEFTKIAKDNIEKTDGDILDAWMRDNADKFEAMDEKLTAAKYNQGGKPSERLYRLYESKTKIAAE